MSSSKKISLWIVCIGGFIAGLYGQFLHNPIVFDDQNIFLLSRHGHLPIELIGTRMLSDLRALPYATLAWSAQIFGFAMPPFRVENLLLHWAVVIGLALFILHLYRTVLPIAPQDGERTSIVTAVLIAASLFALHPVAIYAVGYLVQRTIVMATLFSVLALWSYLHGSAGHSKSWLWLSVALYLLATHCKEHVVMLPSVVVAMTVIAHEDWRTRLRQNWPIFLGYAAVGLLTLYQSRYIVGTFYEINSAEMLEGVRAEHAHTYSVLTQSWLFFKYLGLWLFPNPAWMSVDMREPFAQSLLSPYLLAFTCFIAWGAGAFRLLMKRGSLGLVGFGMLFPWLMFMTEFSTVRVQEIFVLYRSYIWALGGVIVLPLILRQLNARLVIMVAVLFSATLFIISMERLSSFSHPILLWDDAEKLVKDRQALPGASRIYYNRGSAWLYENRADLALPDLQLAARLSPKYSPIYFNLGNAYYKSNQYEQAIQAYSRAILLDQEQNAQPNFRYYFGRAASYEADKKEPEAANDYKMTCLLTSQIGCDKSTQSGIK